MEDTNDLISKDVVPMPVLVYGRPASSETAMVRDRLEELEISFVEVDIDQDQDAARLVKGLNNGVSRTPTIVFGDQEFFLAEPTMEELDRALKRAGYEVGK